MELVINRLLALVFVPELQLGTWQLGDASQITANRTAPKLFQIMIVIRKSKKAVSPRRAG